MKQKILMAVIGLGLVFLVAGCGGKYSDVLETNREFIKLMKVYVDDMAGVGSPADAAKAINRLADGMEKLVPKMKALKKKYPELQDPDKLPEELKVTEKEMEEIGRKFAESFMKLMAYMADKDVQAAQARLSSIMSSMGKGE
jgi:predicted nuclease with TOPRIM domain